MVQQLARIWPFPPIQKLARIWRFPPIQKLARIWRFPPRMLVLCSPTPPPWRSPWWSPWRLPETAPREHQEMQTPVAQLRVLPLVHHLTCARAHTWETVLRRLSTPQRRVHWTALSTSNKARGSSKLSKRLLRSRQRSSMRMRWPPGVPKQPSENAKLGRPTPTHPLSSSLINCRPPHPQARNAKRNLRRLHIHPVHSPGALSSCLSI